MEDNPQTPQPNQAPSLPPTNDVNPQVTTPQITPSQAIDTTAPPAVVPQVILPQAAQQPSSANSQSQYSQAQSPVPPVSQGTQLPQATENRTDVFGILSIVCFFFFQLLGLIFGIIGLRKAKKYHYKNTLSLIGTILNSIGVGIMLLIIPALLVTTFSGIQTKGRDTERQTDIKALRAQLEAYYSQQGHYPLFADVNSEAWRQANMQSLDKEALSDPQSNPKSYDLASTPGAKVYSYQVYNSDGITPCTVAIKCANYTLTTTAENFINGSTVYTLKGSNGQSN